MSFWKYISQSLGFYEEPKEKEVSITRLNASKIAIEKPVSFDDLVRFVRKLGLNVPLIVNFSYLDTKQAERGLDFVCGAVCALRGSFERIGEGIYLYAPHNITIEINKKGKG